MENPISISLLNDFIFCPVSIYFHSVDCDSEKILYQGLEQINGTYVHRTIDTKKYSSKNTIYQGTTVYSEKYNLIGKIDIYDFEKKILIERKKHIKRIYDGYIFQLYAQYFALNEMGFVINELKLYSFDDNKMYHIDLPDDNLILLTKFNSLINSIQNFNINAFIQNNVEKCDKCIYEPLCSYSVRKKYDYK